MHHLHNINLIHGITTYDYIIFFVIASLGLQALDSLFYLCHFYFSRRFGLILQNYPNLSRNHHPVSSTFTLRGGSKGILKKSGTDTNQQ